MIEYPQLNTIPAEYIQQKIKEFLEEDIPDYDKTGEAIFDSNDTSRAIIQAEEDTVLAGINLLPYFFENSDIDIFYHDGDFVKKDVIVAAVRASTAEILRKERVLLNLLQRMSGIATLTCKYAHIAKAHNVKILDTRKTTPGLRLFEKYAVCKGGGYNHRMDLSSGILIKDNHIEAAGSISNAINKIKNKNYNLPIEIEVENELQIREALDVDVDGFLLDNMTREQTISAVNLIRNYRGGEDIFIESSGGITLKNIKNYVDTGINAISIGALTHSVKAADIHIEFGK